MNMKLLPACFALCFLLLTFTTFAAEDQKQIFSLAEFKKSHTYKEILSIPDAYELKVYVMGSTEAGKEKVFLYNEENQLITNAPLSGQIDCQEIVVGSTIRVEFKTGTRVSGGQLTVEIAKKDSNQVYHEIKTKLATSAHKLLEINAVEIKTMLEQHLKELTVLRDKVNEIQDVKPIMPEVITNLMNLAKIYHHLITLHPPITRLHQQELEEIRLLKQRTQGYRDKARKNVKLYMPATGSNEPVDLSTVYATEQALWEKLFTQEVELESKLMTFSQKISALLDKLTELAKIYQKSADLALMSETAWGVLKELTQETEIPKLSGEIGNEDDAIREVLMQLQ